MKNPKNKIKKPKKKKSRSCFCVEKITIEWLFRTKQRTGIHIKKKDSKNRATKLGIDN